MMMRGQVIRGLKWEEKPDYEGRMFLTDFTEQKARATAQTVKAELPRLTLLGGDHEFNAATAVNKLEQIASDNLELFVYGIKAALTSKDYKALNHTYRDALIEIIASTIDNYPEKHMPIFKHMLQVWPHNQSWSAVSDLLARVYEVLQYSDPECIGIVGSGLLRDASTWETAMHAMMSRAKHIPTETLRQFEEIFDFLAIYGDDMRGRRGIQLPSTIYSYQSSAMRLAFEAQPEDVQRKLREMREIRLMNTKPMLDATRNMAPVTATEGYTSCFPEVEALLKQGKAEEAQAYLNKNFNVWKDFGWNAVKQPETIHLVGNLMRTSAYSFNDKQQLVFRLSNFLRNTRNNREAGVLREAVYDLLTTYEALDDSDEEAILAGCANLMARASVSIQDVPVTPELSAEVLKLVQRHADMEVFPRGLVDGTEARRGIWGYMLRTYGLHPLIKAVLEKMLRGIQMEDAEMVRRTFKTIAATFHSPRLNEDSRVLNDAVPNDLMVETIRRVLAYENGVFHRTREYMHTVLSAIIDALGKVLTQETYSKHYREIVTLLNIYGAALPASDQQRERSVINTVHDWADDFRAR